MPTLRQKVDVFCKDAGAKVDASDKLRTQVKALKTSIQTMKADHRKALKAAKAAAKTQKVKAEPKAKTQRVKLTDEQKGQRKREKAVLKELAKAPKIKQEVKMNPLPAQAEPMMPAPVAAPSLAPAVKGGRSRHRRMRW